MGTIDHAKRELELAGMFDKDSDYGGMLAKSVMELVELFSSQGHSGASAGMTVSLFNKVALYKNLSPLTGNDDEWNEVGNNVFQNKRASGVFKEGKEGQAYYIDAILWRLPGGSSWSGGAYLDDKDIRSRQFIKGFPFTPKTFYVDVTETEPTKDNFVFHVQGLKQLDEAMQYYQPTEEKTND